MTQLPAGPVGGGTPARHELLLVGCGNILRRDDGVGPVLIRHLWERGIPDGVRVVDGGTAGMDVAFRIRAARRVVIVDAARTGARPGTIYRVPGPELADLPPLAGLHSHAFRWDHALALATWLDAHWPDERTPGPPPAREGQPAQEGRAAWEDQTSGRSPFGEGREGSPPPVGEGRTAGPVPVAGRLGSAAASRPDEVTVFLIEAECVDAGWELSAAVRQAMWEVIGLIERDFLAGFRSPRTADTRPGSGPAAREHGRGGRRAAAAARPGPSV
ncbi:MULTISPECIES: hydrogenase maturation protease [Protofrankia]|uniref:Hydrogenase maturation protease n=1 Tax=Candidatus Protofrankia datiscae TaxID=2716812 RepID=F8B256_9ACTN|nr:MULTISPECIES: hydrogenase maturation protease [Protofrankia]AEH09850.1 hydrogenase maturation protease [Candidatus Protofrankia datiscae]